MYTIGYRGVLRCVKFWCNLSWVALLLPTKPRTQMRKHIQLRTDETTTLRSPVMYIVYLHLVTLTGREEQTTESKKNNWSVVLAYLEAWYDEDNPRPQVDPKSDVAEDGGGGSVAVASLTVTIRTGVSVSTCTTQHDGLYT